MYSKNLHGLIIYIVIKYLKNEINITVNTN